MPTFTSRTERSILAGAALALSAITLSLLTSGFLPADPALERARAEQILARGERVQNTQVLSEARFHTALVTTIIR
jgi:hypothetical protein